MAQANDDLILGGRYKVLPEELGSGTSGQVLKGLDIQTNEYVAIKMSRSSERRQNDSIKEEAATLNELQGIEGVPEIYCDGCNGRRFYIVMELFDQDLFEMFLANGCCSITDAAFIAQKMIRVLEGIHDRGYIHLDLKPENLMVHLSNPNDSFLVDFGAALKFFDETGDHVKPNVYVDYRACTKTFATNRVLRFLSSSRQDDLIMLGYVLLDLMHLLPWSERTHDFETMFKEKADLCKSRDGGPFSSLPLQFYEYMVYCEELEFTQRPNYRYLESLFKSLLETEGQNGGQEMNEQNGKNEKNELKSRKGKNNEKAGKRRTVKRAGQKETSQTAGKRRTRKSARQN